MAYCGSPEDSWFYNPPNRKNGTELEDAYLSDESQLSPSLGVLSTLKWFSDQYQPIHGYLCLVLCSFGLIANLSTFVVLTRPNMRTSINIILAAIALCDTGTMSTYLIYVLHFYVANQGVSPCTTYTYAWMNFILFHSLWSILLHSSSIWLVVLLALMRLAVMRRAKCSQAFLNPENVWKLMLYIYAPLGILCIPVIFTHSVFEIPNGAGVPSCLNHTVTAGPAHGSGVFTVVPSDAALSNDCTLLKAVLWINGLCFKLLPCILLAFSIWGLLRTLSEAKERNSRIFRRRSETGQNSKYFNSRTTKMLLAILLIFLVTELPQAFVATLSGLNPQDIYFKIYPVVGDILDLLSLLNSGVNFLLYCAMSSRFRSTFAELFAPKFVRMALRRRRRGFSVSDNEAAIYGVTVTAACLETAAMRAELVKRASTSQIAYGTNAFSKSTLSNADARHRMNSMISSARSELDAEMPMRSFSSGHQKTQKRRSTMLTLLGSDSPCLSPAKKIDTPDNNAC